MVVVRVPAATGYEISAAETLRVALPGALLLSGSDANATQSLVVSPSNYSVRLGGEVVSTDAYHARRLRRDAHDIDELRPEGRAWLVTHGQRMIPEHAIGQNEAHALWKAWSGAR